ncbi:hypothetical protein [Chitinimonas sp.]|uniref:hypothetical protein n=1 Tax=Chitinimonas sp. TaxID=1934313 RepID=UPI0035B38662
MLPNTKTSEEFALLASVDPASQATGTVTTGWINTTNFAKFMALISTGVLGAAATVDAKIQQAQDNVGTGAKDVTGKAIVQIIKATGDNKQALINFRGEDLDINGGFGFVRVSVTVGTAASQAAAYLFGAVPRFAPAEPFNQAAVAQVI